MVYIKEGNEITRSLRLPFHIPLALHETQRFLALPEINMSPQVFLLPLMDVGTFVLVNTLIMYTIGFAGGLAIQIS